MNDNLRTRIAAMLSEDDVAKMADAVIAELTEAIPPIVATAIQGYVQSELAAITPLRCGRLLGLRQAVVPAQLSGQARQRGLLLLLLP